MDDYVKTTNFIIIILISIIIIKCINYSQRSQTKREAKEDTLVQLEVKPRKKVESTRQLKEKTINENNSKQRKLEKSTYKGKLKETKVSQEDDELVKLRERVKMLELELNLELQNSKQLSARLAKATSTNELNSKYAEQSFKNTLYEDLTNLLIQNVKIRSAGEFTLSCFQSSKKGDLVFKLSTTPDYPGIYVYSPCIDPTRDSILLKSLPQFLQEEILFSKEKTFEFYWKLLHALN
ncbi:13928_t:CDS:2 [Entrophospora sp. SA101]|nr:13928_t:CDS:2 [Entrophospora sp. SA101]CAJ0824390.1 3431_t:CDS:2 [Entrophospora sp. SA101]CAJ0834456.1 4684_t:CDS:2 [Entrophospora sp. SA101]